MTTPNYMSKTKIRNLLIKAGFTAATPSGANDGHWYAGFTIEGSGTSGWYYLGMEGGPIDVEAIYNVLNENGFEWYSTPGLFRKAV
jgi:hypothetical protein